MSERDITMKEFTKALNENRVSVGQNAFLCNVLLRCSGVKRVLSTVCLDCSAI